MTRTITVKGIGGISAKPDYIELTLSVDATEKDYEKAMENAAERIALLEKAVEGTGFEKGALKTLCFKVDTHEEQIKDQDGHYRWIFAGYCCTYRFQLGFDFDSGRLADVLSAVTDSGAKPELKISFTVKDPTQINEALLMNAAANARKKAELLCHAAGAELGRLCSINYNWSELTIVSPTSYEADAGMPMAPACRCAPEISPEDINLHDTAVFVWEIM
ncbi:MAG: SIMPL domain-containing protein [Subdoligranulum sp.]|nr:SIMPL domain-containing protein [Subdoligranulum sp.]